MEGTVQLVYQEHILDIVTHANNLTGTLFDVRGLKPVARPDFRDEIQDSPSVFYLPGFASENNTVLIVSQDSHPNFIERAVNNIRIAHDVLSDHCSAVVLEPIVASRHHGLSYAIWPEHRAISKFRLIRAVQKRWLSPRVIKWLSRVAVDSINRDFDNEFVERSFRAPLENVTANPKLPNKLRSSASKGLQYLASTQWFPVTVLQHSDFWLGNILLLKNQSRPSPSSNKFGFYVIDWGGATVGGAPAFDLVRYCISVGMPLQRARQELLAYAQAIQITPEELIYYLIIALGQIGMNLEQFPENRYVDLCVRVFNYTEAMGFSL